MSTLPTPPCYGQTGESVAKWLKENVKPGCVVVIRNTQAGILSYQLAIVERLGNGRFHLDKAGESGGVSFYFSGKNCFHPKGQTRLVEPTPSVLAACEWLSSYGMGYGNSTL